MTWRIPESMTKLLAVIIFIFHVYNLFFMFFLISSSFLLV
uniref:Uncharacterized protein n=1 Tax=Populus trichocarpa TaxID=3694 RepID=A0A3N7ERW1_POPTR